MIPQYIDNNQRYGLKHDYKAIDKLFNSLKTPNDLFSPLTLPRDENLHWHVLLSERSTGKTTQLLLYALCMFWYEKTNFGVGTRCEYIRQSKEMLAPKNTADLYNTILDFHYVEKLTENRYNTIIYKAKRWYLAKINNETNEIEEILDDCICCMNSIDQTFVIKSTYNSPYGDFILVDEFISKTYQPNEFVNLCQLISTIRRDRMSVNIYMVANTITPYSKYFTEMNLEKIIHKLKPSDRVIAKTPLNMVVFIEWIKTKKSISEKIRSNNIQYFGFENGGMNSIIGGNWEVKNFPHLPQQTETEERVLLSADFFIKTVGQTLQLELWQSDVMGLYVFAHEFTKEIKKQTATIYTVDNTNNKYKFYGKGYRKVDRILWMLKDRNKWLYSTNEVGLQVENYLKECKLYELEI